MLSLLAGAELQMHPTVDELQSTVARMEAHLSALTNPTIVHLMVLYGSLCQRFECDLAHSARDVVLAKSAALMLIQEVALSQQHTT